MYQDDGKTHINIYSKGRTELGRWLSNFTYCPIITEDGPFNSIEGYWYWLGCKNDELRLLHGFRAKEAGRNLGAPDWIDTDIFKDKIKKAISLKLDSNSSMKNQLATSKLPLKHYYVYGNRVIEPKEGAWIIEYIDSLRR